MGLASASSKARPTGSLKGWGSRLRDVRDIALVGFGGIYAFGYVARAIHAWDNNLGVLPGAELQYFVAGFLLLVPPALVLAAIFGLWRLFRSIAAWEAKGPRRRARIDTALGGLLLTGLVVFYVSNAGWFVRLVPVHESISTIAMVVFASAFTAMFVLANARPESRGARVSAPPAKDGFVLRALERVGVFLGGLFVINLGLLVVILLFLAMLLGTAKVLPVLPQALGGAAPRCAELDVDVTGLTRESIAALFEPGTSPDGSTTKRPRRSRQVLIFHSGADSILVKLPDDARGASPTYELKRSAIDAMRWCGPRTPGRDPAAGRS